MLFRSVRDLLFARLLQYRAFKHVAVMFAELEAAALRSYPRSVALDTRTDPGAAWQLLVGLS